MSDRVTLQTIADALGVSRTTVSNAYNRPDQLAPGLRERILATARRLGYSGPDPAARRLRSGRRDAVGLLLGDDLSYAFADPAAVMLLQGIARATEAAGLALLVPAAGSGSAVREAVVDAFCIYSSTPSRPDVVAALERQIPLVVVDEPPLDGHAYVGVEDRVGARRVAEHLLGLGHRRFAILTGRTADDGYAGPLSVDREQSSRYYATAERLAGWREALTGAGVDWAALPRVEVPGNRGQDGLDGARTLLAADPRPTALLALTDVLALGALEAAREAGLSVPDDVSIAGFDDIPAAAWTPPGLTTVRQPLLEKGETAGRLLLADSPERRIVLPVELVVRGSTAAPPA